MSDFLIFLKTLFSLCCGGMLISAVVAVGAMLRAKPAPDGKDF